jgi:hypothetical protein
LVIAAAPTDSLEIPEPTRRRHGWLRFSLACSGKRRENSDLF